LYHPRSRSGDVSARICSTGRDAVNLKALTEKVRFPMHVHLQNFGLLYIKVIGSRSKSHGQKNFLRGIAYQLVCQVVCYHRYVNG